MLPAWRAEDDDLSLPPLSFAHDGASGSPGPQKPSDDDAVKLTDRDGGIERLVGRRFGLGQLGVQGQLEGHGHDADSRNRRATIRGKPAGEVDCLLGLSPRFHGYEDAAVLERGPRADQDRRQHRLAERRSNHVAPVDRVQNEPEDQPAESDPPGIGLLNDDDQPRAAVPSPPKIANNGQSIRRCAGLGARESASRGPAASPSAMIEACAIENESIAPNAYISPRKAVLPGSRRTIEINPPNTSSDSHGV